MAEARVKKLVRAIVNGVQVMGSLEGFSPPEVAKEMEGQKGGRFFSDQQMVGVTVGNASLKLSGISADLLASLGVSRDESCEVTVLGAAEDADGNKVPLRWELSGEVVAIKEGEVKPGVESHDLEFSPRAYKHTDAGKVIYDLNAKTQKCVVGGKDLLQDARGMVELP